MAETNQEKHEEAYRLAEDRVRREDPAELAERAGATWSPETSGGPLEVEEDTRGRLEIASLGHTIVVSWPDLTMGSSFTPFLSFPWRLMTLHYLTEVLPEEPGRQWIGYRELPNGLFYANTVTREVEVPLANRYGAAPEEFRQAGAGVGGRPLEMADVAFEVRPFPRVPVTFALWAEDEEFPAKVKVLYERTGSANLPLQDLRIVAEIMGKLLLGSPDSRRA